MDESSPNQSASLTNRRRDWSGLNSELLALIFTRLKPQDWVLTTIPFVCRSWSEALKGPDCWVHIDLECWCRRACDESTVDSAVCKLIRRSNGLAKSLHVYNLGNSGFFNVCSSGSYLRALKMRMSEVDDHTITKQIKSLSMLTKLDISYCLRITSKTIELIGKQCKSLVEFRRNMPPPCSDVIVINESVALSIANTMHGLQHLELAYGRFSNHGFDYIISQCKNLRVLDVRGCWCLNLTEKYDDMLRHIKDFLPPWENDNLGLEFDDYDYDDDEYDDEDDGEDDCLLS